MKNYYREKLKEGQDFENYVVQKMYEKMGIVITLYKTRHEQFTIGESHQGYEIKLDNHFRSSNQLYIEVKESNEKWGKLVDSGIFRKDNTMVYIIGDYKGVYLISKKQMRLIYNKELKLGNNIYGYKGEGNMNRTHDLVQTATSLGMMFQIESANKMYDYISFE